MDLFSLFRREQKFGSFPKRVRDLDRISFEQLSKRSYEYLNEQQHICEQVYKIHSYQNWFYDQLTGKLTFSDNGIDKLVIDFEEVGSVSLISNTWFWAWENPHTEEKVKSYIAKVRQYGIKRNFEKLIDAKWPADQYDGWEMTAISSYLLQAKGAYRPPIPENELYSFMIFKDIRWVEQ